MTCRLAGFKRKRRRCLQPRLLTLPSLPTPQTRNATPTSLLLPRGIHYDPFEHAHMLGLQVLIRPIALDEQLLPREYATVVIRSDLRGVHKRTALAHGIAHWDLMHPDDRPKYERQADQLAALHLIHPRELEDVLSWTNDAARVVQELGVTQRLLRAYLATVGTA